MKALGYKRALNRPSVLQTVVQRSAVDSEAIRPIGCRGRVPVVREQNARALVPLLFVVRGPSAVVRVVPLVVFLAIDGVSTAGSPAHVLEEVLVSARATPARTDRDTTIEVVRMLRMPRRTASFQQVPRVVFRRVVTTLPVFESTFLSETSTRRAASILQRCRRNSSFDSARTSTRPVVAARYVMREAKYGPAPKHSVNKNFHAEAGVAWR
jgi:hypothetical protein